MFGGINTIPIKVCLGWVFWIEDDLGALLEFSSYF